ncbi:MAG: hypothetical protein R3C49_16970 [Planctomycetaceae bacterium]
MKSGRFTRFRHRRKGGIFHYYMMYLFLTGSIMLMGGAFLHAVLKAEAADARTAQQMKTLLQLESTLRQDFILAATPHVNADGNKLTICSDGNDDSQQIVWTASENVVHRRILEGETPRSQERFLFSAGSQGRFELQPDRLVVTLQEARLRMPSATRTAAPSSLQIIIALPGSPSAEVSE